MGSTGNSFADESIDHARRDLQALAKMQAAYNGDPAAIESVLKACTDDPEDPLYSPGFAQRTKLVGACSHCALNVIRLVQRSKTCMSI